MGWGGKEGGRQKGGLWEMKGGRMEREVRGGREKQETERLQEGVEAWRRG